MEILDYVKINENSREAKYQQIVKSIIHNVVIGNLVIDQKIPSINNFSEQLYVSRDTVEKAYNILKKRQVIASIRGKGFYIARTKLISKVKILFLVNKLSSYKMRVYNSFVNTIGSDSIVDLHIYHCDESLFLSLLDKYKSDYDYYVIMPHFKTETQEHINITDKVSEAINKIPKKRLVLMDNTLKQDHNQSITVYQDFKKDIYTALKTGINKISKYNKVILVYPQASVYPYPKRILQGVKLFCLEHHFDFEVVDRVSNNIPINKGELFIIIEEGHLINFIRRTRESNYKLGKDIGVISYNDTPLKEVFGVSVVSTDFETMGEQGAKMILDKENRHFKVPFNFIDRDSV